MKTSLLPFFTIVLLIPSLSGCSSAGMHTSTHLTNVQLATNNFRIVARSISGEAKAGYVLGVSFGVGMYTQIIGIARISGEKALYKAAMDNLWQNYEAKFGTVEGKKLALVNVRYDVEALNLIVYTQPHVTIQADVIEFID